MKNPFLTPLADVCLTTLTSLLMCCLQTELKVINHILVLVIDNASKMREHGPEWQYVVLIEEKEKGNPKVQCCFCDKVFVGGPARIRQHLHGEKNMLIKPCEKVPVS
jgi:hypothetical protein